MKPRIAKTSDAIAETIEGSQSPTKSNAKHVNVAISKTLLRSILMAV